MRKISIKSREIGDLHVEIVGFDAPSEKELLEFIGHFAGVREYLSDVSAHTDGGKLYVRTTDGRPLRAKEYRTYIEPGDYMDLKKFEKILDAIKIAAERAYRLSRLIKRQKNEYRITASSI